MKERAPISADGMTRIQLLLILFVSAGVAAWFTLGSPRTQGAIAPTLTPKAKVAIAVLRDMPVYVRALGTIEAFNSVTIHSRVDGVIERVLFSEGAMVPENAPLFQIDPTLYRARMSEAQAAVAKDEAALRRAGNDLNRGKHLAAKGLLSSEALDQQQTNVAELEAAIQGDRAALAAAAAQLEWTTIRAPIAGRVGKRLVDAGNLVHAADNIALTDIVQLNPVNVIFAVTQERIPALRARIEAGDLPVELRTLDDQALIVRGHSALLYNTVELGTGSIKVRSVVENKDLRLWPGEAVNVRIVVADDSAVVSIPEKAVFEAMSGPAIYIVDSTNHIALRPVKPRSSADGLVGLEQGLKESERVIIADQERLAPGREVVPEVVAQ